MNLFRLAPKLEDLYSVDENLVAESIKKCGFYLRKANQLKRIAQIVMEEWNGEIPSDMDKLMSLPGVGIKTASLVLNLSFNMDAICVDCHVHQISNRLGWVDTDKPEVIDMADDFEETEETSYADVPGVDAEVSAADQDFYDEDSADSFEDGVDAGFSELLKALKDEDFSDKE